MSFSSHNGRRCRRKIWVEEQHHRRMVSICYTAASPCLGRGLLLPEDSMPKMIAGIESVGHDRTGNYIQINVRTAEGESVSLNMGVNVAIGLNQMFAAEIAKAHKV